MVKHVPTERRYLEDFVAGQRIELPGEYEMTPARVHAFATDYDPQPIHLDEQAARAEMFGQIVASGWHSLAATMRLVVLGRPLGATPIVGLGVDNLRYVAPVRPGDVLRASLVVLDVRTSASRPERGFVRLRVTTRNQRDEEVLTQDWTLVLPRRAT
jgi:acyl dehydratase